MKKALLAMAAAAALFTSQVAVAQGGPRGPRGQAGNCPRMAQNCPRRANCPNPNCPNPNCPCRGQQNPGGQTQSQRPATPPAK